MRTKCHRSSIRIHEVLRGKKATHWDADNISYVFIYFLWNLRIPMATFKLTARHAKALPNLPVNRTIWEREGERDESITAVALEYTPWKGGEKSGMSVQWLVVSPSQGVQAPPVSTGVNCHHSVQLVAPRTRLLSGRLLPSMKESSRSVNLLNKSHRGVSPWACRDGLGLCAGAAVAQRDSAGLIGG